MTRPSWPEYFLRVARTISERASCPRASIGCVIVSSDGQIVATGYNGAPRGFKNCLDNGCIILNDHCMRSNHAEMNAMMAAKQRNINLRGCTAYIVGPRLPCERCGLVMIEEGIVDWLHKE